MKRFNLFIICAALMLSPACAGEGLSAKTVGEIKAPRGYSREPLREYPYSSWLRRLPVKGDNIILKHDGKTVSRSYYNIFAVIDMPLLFIGDIEQCADWGFRFWSEYHKERGILDRLYLFDYSGNKRYFSKCGRSFNSFLKYSMNYANSYSIKSGCGEVFPSDIRGGDMLVQNRTGGIGHVSIVMDVCKNSGGEKLYLIGYSFMPAQQFHIERASDRYGKEGWFTLEGYVQYLENNLNFGRPVLRRFR
ncbi:MAG TPA: DUF4846 domain-containing protein [Spirochaetota bacterium]|nr:DUF4846 domain-containing protein [Spirochaetota bacterium]HPJ35932.1 DUF4846 domain-containing protein [Spirochaetota bacterium]